MLKIIKYPLTFVSLIIVLIAIYYWVTFQFYLSFIPFWIAGIVLAFMFVFILNQLIPLWIIPLMIVGLAILLHLGNAIHLYYLPKPPGPQFIQAFSCTFRLTYAGDNRMAFFMAELPFVGLTIFITFGFFLFYKIKNEIF